MRSQDNPNSDVIFTIPKGEKVIILNKIGLYYEISFKGRSGFINEMYVEPVKAISKSPTNRLWNEIELKFNWKENGIDEIEGIYEQFVSANEKKQGAPAYKLGLRKTSSGYSLHYLSGASYANITKWRVGDLKAVLNPTATKYVFVGNWHLGDKSGYDRVIITIEPGIMKLLYSDGSNIALLKLFPSAEDNTTISPKGINPSSGTGFAISSDGLLVTNNHVIEGAKSILIRGVNADFQRTYSGRVLISDTRNDLAIVKIDYIGSLNLGTIPFTITTNNAEVGENIFVLGYPLRATMGDEMKLTNGIISSKSGFQGDVTSYQISAPVQPGNSGGPVFDERGNLVGIINAKHLGAENASYAIKSGYLINLIGSMTVTPSLQKTNSLIGKPLTQQVQLLRKFVYIIEVY